jgi:hypothetical protein
MAPAPLDATASDAPAPAVEPPAEAAPDLPPATIPGFDTDRLNAARERLRASAEPADDEVDDDGSAAEAVAAASAPSATADSAAAEADASTGDGAPPADTPPADAAPGTPAEPRPDAPHTGAATTANTRAGHPAKAPLPAVVAKPPAGPPAPWLPAALKRLAAHDPETAGRIVVGMLPAQGLVTQRRLSYDLVLSDRGTVAVDVADGRAAVRALEGPRSPRQLDFRVLSDHAGLGRLLLTRRGLRRRARVRGSRRRLRELRRLAREPLALRDLAASGATLEPALALWLGALAIDSAATFGHRFTIAHAPLPGGPPDAWMRIQHGAPIAVLRTRPGEDPAVTVRCTRGALLALLTGMPVPAGQGAAVDGDIEALDRVRAWIRQTEFPGH